jgi:hypothetical protein
LIIIDLCGPEIAIQAARNFRALRAAGISTPFVKLLGLRAVA